MATLFEGKVKGKDEAEPAGERSSDGSDESDKADAGTFVRMVCPY
jgi:hypothetical protein